MNTLRIMSLRQLKEYYLYSLDEGLRQEFILLFGDDGDFIPKNPCLPGFIRYCKDFKDRNPSFKIIK